MNCPECQQGNRLGAKFCNGCGAKLEIICQGCSQGNPPESRFCDNCGQPLADASAAAPKTNPVSPETYTPKHLAEKILTSKSALEGERKQVTVLFADLKGSMELLADQDPEQSRNLLNAVVERMMEAVHRYEGTVNNVMGDGIMAIFGAPLAHEDHGLRACYAAIAMQEAIRAYSEEAWRTLGIMVRIRVGLNSGEVVVGNIGNDLHMDYNAVGQTTHLASRMEQLAPPGAIHLTADTFQLVKESVRVNSLGPVPVKGLVKPVEVFELIRVQPGRKLMSTVAGRGVTAFVGRRTELEVLQQAAKQAQSGRGQVVAVVGEAGVGKSRLFGEFVHSSAMSDWQTLESGSVSYGKASAYLPVIALLKTYFQIDERDEQLKIGKKVTEKLLTLDEALKPTLPALLTLLDVAVDDLQWQALDPRQRRRRTLDAIKSLLLRESQERSLCLVLEDLHWVDSETQAFLDTLIDSLPTARVLLLANYRPEYQHDWGNKTFYTQLRVDPLPATSADELLQTLLGTDSGLNGLKRVLIKQTEGNPFFLEESVQALVETGTLSGERGDYRLMKNVTSIQVPPTVQAVLAARIDRLSSEVKHILQLASVIGENVPFNLLQSISEMAEDELLASLDYLQGAEFLYETRLFPDVEYTFKHGLTYQVAYNSLLVERRRTLHAAIVDAMESTYSNRLREHVEGLARHAFIAERWKTAARYLQQAGTKTITQAAYQEGQAYFERALSALAHLPETEENIKHAIDVRLELGTVLAATKGAGSAEYESCCNKAKELCEQINDPTRLFPALWGLWHSNMAHGRQQAARQLGNRLLVLAEEQRDTSLLLEAHHSLWPTLLTSGELADAKRHLDRGLALYDPQRHRDHASRYGGHDPGVCGGFHAALTLWLLGYPDQALRAAYDSVSLAQNLSQPLSLGLALFHTAWTHYLCGDLRGVAEHARAALDVGTSHGFPLVSSYASCMLGYLMATKGDDEAGIAQFDGALTNLETVRANMGFRASLLLSLKVAIWQKVQKTEKALGGLADALTKEVNRGFKAELLRLKGETFLKGPVSLDDEARDCFQEAIQAARSQQAKSLELRAATSMARLLQRQGKTSEAHEMLIEIYRWFTEGFDTADLKEAKALLDELS